jgi:hypothetical protein
MSLIICVINQELLRKLLKLKLIATAEFHNVAGMAGGAHAHFSVIGANSELRMHNFELWAKKYDMQNYQLVLCFANF